MNKFSKFKYSGIQQQRLYSTKRHVSGIAKMVNGWMYIVIDQSTQIKRFDDENRDKQLPLVYKINGILFGKR